MMTPYEACNIARERGLDVVEVAPDARPPVCKIMDYGRFLYEESKRSAPKPKHELKTITLRPKTGEHDLQTKINQATKFLERGDKVKFQMRMRGRERVRPEMWVRQLQELIDRLSDISTCTQTPRDDGKAISAIVEPGAKPGSRPKVQAPASGPAATAAPPQQQSKPRPQAPPVAKPSTPDQPS